MAARVALVTGGGRGLGAATAARLHADGWAVVVADIEAPAQPPPYAYVHCDVSDDTAVDELMESVIAKYGRLDAVINNAGIGGPSETLADCSPYEFRRTIEVNLIGPFLVSRAAIPHLIRSAPGSSIVNIGSLFGQQGVTNGGAYCASKGGVTLLTQTLALELADVGVRVNTVAPGNMLTLMHMDEINMRADALGTTPDEMEARIRATIPLGRHGTGDDIAGVITWLVSDDASYVTGQTISVNGGAFLT